MRRLVEAHTQAGSSVLRRAARQRAGAQPRARCQYPTGEVAAAMSDGSTWPTVAPPPTRCWRGSRRRSAPAARVHRRGARRRQDLPDARGRARASRQGVDVVIGFVETSRPRRHAGAGRRPRESCRCAQIEYRGDGRSRRWTSTRSSPRRRRCASSTSWRTPTCPASAHQKRYEDVLELLDAGINVITAVNIQHIESLNDAIASTTGVRVRETVPD